MQNPLVFLHMYRYGLLVWEQGVDGCVLPSDCQLAGNSNQLVRMRLFLTDG